MTVEVVLVDRDGIAHRLHKVPGEPVMVSGQRVRLLCEEMTLPLDVFDLTVAHRCGPAMRCAGCFLTPVVMICFRCDNWGRKGDPCPDCGHVERERPISLPWSEPPTTTYVVTTTTGVENRRWFI